MNEDEFGQKMNSMPKYVVSTTLADDDANWDNSTVIRDDVVGQVMKLKAEVDGDILIGGSAKLIQSLAADGLIDEYGLMVFPIVLGTGKRLFADGFQKGKLKLTDSKPAARTVRSCSPTSRRNNKGSDVQAAFDACADFVPGSQEFGDL
jgi:dihydrofolate reductase